jgi:hypothetical protein
MTGPNNKEISLKSADYEAPRFERHDLATITLGGSPGSGDSGSPTSLGPFGSRPNEQNQEESFEEGWDNQV